MILNKERMSGFGEYLVDGYRVNYLFGLNDLCKKYLKNNFSVLELGVNNGVSTELFCKYSKDVTAVDLLRSEEFENILKNSTNLTFYQLNFSEFYKLNQRKFNFIYIDGSHDYESVKFDIENCINFLHSDGIIAGHDYNSSCSGVVNAVDEFFSNVEVFEDSSWAKKIN